MLYDVVLYLPRVLRAYARGMKTRHAGLMCAGIAVLFAACSHHQSVLPTVPLSQHRVLQSGALSDQYSSTVLNDGPAAYYRLDESGTATAADSSGHNLNGTIGASVSTGSSGLLASVSDAAMTFPGSSNAASTVNVPANAALQPASALSVEAWIKFTANPKTYAVIAGYGSDSFYAPYDLFFRAGNKVVAQFYLSSGVLEVAAPSALSANTVYHIVSTFDGSTGRLYVNGLQVASGAKTGTIANYQPNVGLTIGDDAGFSDPAFSGTIDEVAVYGSVLTPAQIANHYQAGTTTLNGTPTPTASASPTPTPTPTPTASASPSPSPTPPPTGAYAQTVLADAPGAYYHLDETASTAVDASGHTLNGTIGTAVSKGASGLVPTYADTAMAFGGTRSASGTVNVPANASLQPASNLSLEAWLRFTSAPAAYTVVVAYGSDTLYAPYDLFFRPGSQLVAQFYLNTGVLEIADPTPLQTNTAYHAVSTFDGSVGRLYVNGVQVAGNTKSGTITNYQAKYGLTIGDDAAFSDPAFIGTVDEVAVYPGKTLTAGQIQAHYAAGTNGNVTPPPSPTPSPTPQPGTDWLTMGFDLQRTGYDPNETSLGPGSFGTLHSVWTASNGGEIGEPAFASGVTVAGGTADILYAGLGNGKFFAYNAANGAVIWSKQLGTSTYVCGTSQYTFGVNGAPTIDRAANRIYVGDGAMAVHALDLATGAEQNGWPVAIGSATGHDFIYSGLTYNPANHFLYATSSSTCDISPWFGRIAALNTQTAAVVNTFYPAQGASGGGIWGFGGASIDPATNTVYVATGNGDSTTGIAQDAFYDENIVALSPDLTSVLASQDPSNPPGGDDEDFGATPLLFQPPGCPGLLAAVNKSGTFDLYSRASIANGPAQQIQMSITSDNGDFIGIPAYDPVTNDVYVGLPATFGIYKPGVAAFSVNSACTLNPTPVWSAQFGADGAATDNDTPRSPITIANGVLYIGDYGTSKAYAFNAATGAQLWTTTLGGAGIVGPIVVNGKLYFGSSGTTMSAWSP